MYAHRRPPRQAVLIGDEPEASFQRRIIQLLRLRGWNLIYHTYDARRSPAGFPDIIAIRNGRGLALEVKSPHGVVKRAQKLWIEGINCVPGFEAKVVRPSDWAWIVEMSA